MNSEIYSLSLATCILLSAGQTTADPNDEDDVVASEALNSVWSGFSSEVMRIPDFAANTRLLIMSFGRFGIFMQMFQVIYLTLVIEMINRTYNSFIVE